MLDDPLSFTLDVDGEKKTTPLKDMPSTGMNGGGEGMVMMEVSHLTSKRKENI